jgi:squalene-hopene/tetraprenyl-beta-curcumene cyclase
MANNGLFYYYQLFAKALDAMHADFVEDAQGTKHDWKKELAAHLFSLQKSNGSWVNTSERWYEGDPNLVTAYTLIALSYCEPEKSK